MSEAQLLKHHAELRQCVSTDAAARGSAVPQGTIRSSEKTRLTQDALSLACGDDHRLHRYPPAGSLPGSTLPTEPARRSFVSGSDGSLSAVTPSGVGGSAPAGGRLGRYTKSSTPPLPLVTPPAGKKGGVDTRAPIRAARAQRYELLSTARNILSTEGARQGLVYGHDYHRTAKCRFIRCGGPNVEVHQERKTGAAFYVNLTACGSVWSCPVCTALIQERRRQEIEQAVEWAYAKELQPMLVTLTFPHRRKHKLLDLLKLQAAALRHLRAGAPWTRWKTRNGYEGLIRSLELTHGLNGWHPHTHELWFVGSHVKAKDAREQILARWEAACIAVGLLDPADTAQLKAFRRHAVDVKGWCSASDYLAKQDDSRHWGVDREVAKASSKSGKASGVHPFGLLALARDGDARAAELYVEYADTMRRTRTRQHYWSPGLKDRVGVKEKSDEALADESREKADVLGFLDDDDWKTVRDAGARAQVLDAAELGGWPAVEALLERLTLAEIARLEAMLSSP